jgi:hypothetical protein
MFEPSATEAVEVILEVKLKGTEQTSITVEVGGGPGSEIIDVIKAVVPKEGAVYTFIVPPGKSWAVSSNTEIEALFTLYLPLGVG